MNLFPRKQVVGVFRGFREGGLEFHADLALPYRNDFQRSPMHGQFVLVQLETPDEAVLGRIASFSSEGRLSFGSGEEYNIRAVQEQRQIPEDLREQYLRYRVDIRILGIMRKGSGRRLTFVPSHRRLPHVGSAVAFPSPEVLREICGHNVDGASIGHFALGEYIYAGNDPEAQDWMRIESPEVDIRFPVSSLVARRSFVFARAGFGKSNLNKLLFSKLYEETPTVEKRDGRKVPVGTVIFDPDGEYFWPDDKGRPGLCDVEHLRDKLVVFTSRQAPSGFYASFTAGGIKLDLRQLRAGDVISIALPPERQDQQNVAKLRSLSPSNWSRLVDLVDRDRGGADPAEIAEILNLSMPAQEAEAIAARSNMANVVGMLHDRSSQFMALLIKALEAGRICVVDVSQMRGAQSFILAGIVLRRIFDRNQEEFTKANPRTIPTIAVIEEAQSVLNERAAAAEPYIAWVKEGRKYDLGALLITQQPGAIPAEILSQGDNWFIFHLLSAHDLMGLKRANAHFSDDLLSSLLNEPIPGQGVFWSSVGGKPYPVPVRVALFEALYGSADPSYSRKEVRTFATELKRNMNNLIRQARALSMEPDEAPKPDGERPVDDEPPDLEPLYRRLARDAVAGNRQLVAKLKGDGAPWGVVVGAIANALSGKLDRPGDKAHQLVAPTIEALLGRRDEGWHTFRRGQKNTLFIRSGSRTDESQT